jgi:hypothetical protein
MAYILPDEQLLTKAESDYLSYAELAALKQRALAGDASAAIALERMNPNEQRLAAMLVKSFGSSPKKQKKPKVNKRSSFEEITEHEKYLRSLLNSADPSEREAARKALKL